MRSYIRLLALPLLLYIVVDFADPSMPGVFFFDSDNLFVDGVVQLVSEEALGALSANMDARAVDSLASRIAPDSLLVVPPPPVVRSRGRSHTRLLGGDPPPSPSASEDH